MELVKFIKENRTYLIGALSGLIVIGYVYGYNELFYWSAIMLSIFIPVVSLVVIYMTINRFGMKEGLLIIQSKSSLYVILLIVFASLYIFALDGYFKKYVLILDSVVIVGLILLLFAKKIFRKV
jgi:hypothetical protein